MASEVYLVMFAQYDDWELVGIYSTVPLAETAVAAYAEARNAEELHDADGDNPPRLMKRGTDKHGTDKHGLPCYRYHSWGGVFMSKWQVDKPYEAQHPQGDEQA